MVQIEISQQIQEILEGVLRQMGVVAQVGAEETLDRGLVFNITSEDSYLLIGKGGANLHALQFVVQAMARKQLKVEEPVKFTVDIDDYRKKREWYLKEAAKNAIEKVKASGHPVHMEPMSSYERRLVHSFVQEHFTEIESTSEGEEPYRKVVITLKKLQ